jgi:hypothetical protein
MSITLTKVANLPVPQATSSILVLSPLVSLPGDLACMNLCKGTKLCLCMASCLPRNRVSVDAS